MKKYGYLSLDFEFNGTAEAVLNVVCVAYKAYSPSGSLVTSNAIWLEGDEDARIRFANFMLDARDTYQILSYSAEAEAQSLLSLDIEPLQFKWVDLYIEYRMFANSNNAVCCGRHLVDGSVKFIKAKVNKYQDDPEYPDYGGYEEPDGTDVVSGGDIRYNLSAAVFKLLNGVKIDTAHKEAMRQAVIHRTYVNNPEEKEEILKYCLSDVEYLFRLFIVIFNGVSDLYSDSSINLIEEMWSRGEYAVRTAHMVRTGMPLDWERLQNFIASVGAISGEMAEQVNLMTRDALHDFVRVMLPREKKKPKKFVWVYNGEGTKGLARIFSFSPKDRKWHRDNGLLSAWIKQTYGTDWPITETGGYKMDRESWDARGSDVRPSLPTVPDQMLRWCKFDSALRGFSTPKGATQPEFLDRVGSDRRCRPHYGIFRAQTSRSQPAATGYILLKPSWMRTLLLPKAGRACTSIDFSSQEVLIAACLSGDEALKRSYDSGDIYLDYAKKTGAVPQSGTKSSHGTIRDCYKSTVLGIMYEMGAFKLSEKIIRNGGGAFHLPWETSDQKYRTVDGRRVLCKVDAGGEILQVLDPRFAMSKEIAAKLIEDFYAIYPDFAQWRKEVLEGYRNNGYLRLVDGWTMWGDNKNPRSVGNCPVQGAGGAILRKSVCFAQEARLDVIATLHDALVIEHDSGDLGAIVSLFEAMQKGFKYYMGREIRMDAKSWSRDYTSDFPGIQRTEKGGLFFPLSNGQQTKCSTLYLEDKGAKDYAIFCQYLDAVQAGYSDIL